MPRQYEDPTRECILVAEDEYLIALGLRQAVLDHGARPIGPFAQVDEALAVLDGRQRVDGAILDINIAGRPVFPVARRLEELGVTFVFATGYDHWTIPRGHAGVERFEKPIDPHAVVSGLLAQLRACAPRGAERERPA
ncbi:response regulator [Pelagibacterium montanilacus]|uniref:response regulator n=1 Tax=Pelagibacterium montanilacus TaxID=2185280 RepID=UPI000F8EFC35|nr:response regulator [Pelagibacterium montanilacus]